MMNIRTRNCFISLFVIIWLFVFHYESLRHFYLNPFFNRELPKIKWLFPPAGWIMFFNVDKQYGFVEVYGLKEKNVHLIDPHDIFTTRTIGFDNIHRNILSTVSAPDLAPSFCRYLHRKFAMFDDFVVVAVLYPDVVRDHYKRFQKVKYYCQDEDRR